MLRTTLAGLRAHAGRMLGTALAVVLGVGFVAGTMIFSDTARAGFYDEFSRTARHVDVAVEPPAGAAGKDGAQRPQLSADVAAAIRALPDVAEADARMVQPLPMLDARGRVISNFGNAGLAVSTDAPADLRAFDLTGRLPAAAGEAVLDDETAAHQHLAAGDAITVLDRDGARHRYTLVGIIGFGTAKQFSGQSVVGLPAAEITRLTGATGYAEIVVRGRGGLSQADLAARVRAAAGGASRAVVVTGDQRRRDLADDATQVAGQFQTVLLIFGVVSLIVAVFVIANTFAILLAQRVRETALLRCVGATRGQIFRSVLLESALVGLFGAVAGDVLGIGVCYALLGLLNGVLNLGVPVHAVVLAPGPLLVGAAVGVLVTVAAALLPALRATRTSPLAALRDLATVRTGSRAATVVRLAVAAVVAAAGIALTAAGRHDTDAQRGTFVIVAGGVVTFLAVLVLAPLFVGPLAALVAAGPARLFGPPVRLAGANARRNPGRTAVTTASLMIGVGLIALFTVLIASIKATAAGQLAGHYPVDYVMTGLRTGDGDGAETAPIPPAYAQALRERPEFSAVVETRTATATAGGHTVRLAAIDPGSLGGVIRPELTSGSLSDLTAGTAIVNGGRALAHEAHEQTITVAVGGRQATFRVVGSTTSGVPGGGPLDALLTWDDLTALAGTTGDTTVMAKAAPSAGPVASRDALDRLGEQYPQIQVSSLADLSSDLDNAVNGLIALFGGLLGTAIVIALAGIANTLALSVVERTRESATVRALGLTRGQLRATLLVEAMLMGVVGALVGISYGLVYGRLVVAQAFAGLRPVIVVPWGWLVLLVAATAVAAMLAAVLPARRAARASIVAAMAET
ncbi:ABC transporter permease [Dactylosporangium sp. NPDC048998]|uniref:ABC transporter permease n=1 Tax=Dactylosporangium sp. NPDC048998 TaxID=3363976 RepID=UPI00371C9DDB